jgi:hypothetical protein
MKEFEKAYNCINKVNTNSSDQKFRTYLPSILKSYIDYLVKIGEIKLKPSNFDLLLNPNTDLTSLYLESKRDSIPFVEYISNLSTN